MFHQKNLPFFAFLLLLFVALKYYFSHTNNDELYFLLKPTSTLVSFITGTSAVYTNTIGYHYEQLNIVIEKSCSGYHLCLLLFVSMSFLVIKYHQNLSGKIKYMLLVAASAWLLTILVNAARIWTSIIIQSITHCYWPQWQPAIHEVIGVFINLSALLAAYFILDKYFVWLSAKNKEVTILTEFK